MNEHWKTCPTCSGKGVVKSNLNPKVLVATNKNVDVEIPTEASANLINSNPKQTKPELKIDIRIPQEQDPQTGKFEKDPSPPTFHRTASSHFPHLEISQISTQRKQKTKKSHNPFDDTEDEDELPEKPSQPMRPRTPKLPPRPKTPKWGQRQKDNINENEETYGEVPDKPTLKASKKRPKIKPPPMPEKEKEKNKIGEETDFASLDFPKSQSFSSRRFEFETTPQNRNFEFLLSKLSLPLKNKHEHGNEGQIQKINENESENTNENKNRKKWNRDSENVQKRDTELTFEKPKNPPLPKEKEKKEEKTKEKDVLPMIGPSPPKFRLSSTTDELNYKLYEARKAWEEKNKVENKNKKQQQKQNKLSGGSLRKSKTTENFQKSRNIDILRKEEDQAFWDIFWTQHREKNTSKTGN